MCCGYVLYVGHVEGSIGGKTFGGSLGLWDKHLRCRLLTLCRFFRGVIPTTCTFNVSRSPKADVRVPYPTGSRGCRDFIGLLSTQRDLEPHNGHPCSDPNQSHITKSSGANPLDHATHCSPASSFYLRKSDLSSEIMSRGSTCHMLSACYLHCAFTCPMPLVMCMCSMSVTLIMKRFLSMCCS